MRAVNLLPAERRGSRRSSHTTFLTAEPLLTAAVGLAVIVVAALVLVGHSAGSQVAARQARVSQLDGQIAKLGQQQKPASQTSSIATRQLTVSTVASQRTAWDTFLWSVSKVIPEDVWVFSMSAQQANSTSTTASTSSPSGFTLTGYTYSQPSVARLMRRLALVPWLSGVSLVTSSKSELSNHTVYQFTVGANFVQLPEVRS